MQPPSNVEMRTSRPRGLSVARGGLPLKDVSRDPAPSARVYLPVDGPASLFLPLSFTYFEYR